MRFIDSAQEVWRESLVGGAVIVAFVVVGLRVGRARDGWAARAIGWWLDHVVRRVVAGRSWFRRASLIAGNNSLVCGAMVLLGSLGPAAWMGVAVVGASLGIGLRLLLASPVHGDHEPRRMGPLAQLAMIVGVGLNLLEVPAIMLSAGLALSRGALSSVFGLTDAFAVFGWVVLPLLVVSAAGEALWMTADPELPGVGPRS